MKLTQALRLTAGDVLALTGGGGKTTTMFRLADEAAQASANPMRVLTTTSTRIFTVQIKRSPAHVVFDGRRQSLADVIPRLEAALARYHQVLLIGQAEPETGKAFGVPPDILDVLAATGRFDLIINEADGSRMRSFKAPASHEPVIPAGTTIVAPVVGIDILGQPLDDEAVHRAALVSRLSGAVMGQPVTAETIVTVMGHPEGGLKNVPARARVIPLLNKVEGPAELMAARRIAAGLLACERVEAVAIGAVQAAADPVTEVHGRTAAVILAAGGSSRFGSPKQLAPWGEQTFIERAVAVALASQARPVIVVLGAEVAQCQALLAGKPVEVVVNRDWPAGQSTSLRAGLAALPANINSAVFLLVDLPGLRPETVDALLQRHRETLAPIVWPEFAGRRGNPILFDRALFPELQQISGDTGGRPLLAAYEAQAERVAVADQGILFDIDYARDLAGD